ncbi:TIGR02206 family membrane protein [Ornithinibacillus caprae]|uniref:YwaF family protein n=1 Tax=Ornithinibacillus caprae TaxID=2678566 RepID=UPI0018C595DF|nr:TIGR02206 family membrane protein [Ornithinibacillus caprae]
MQKWFENVSQYPFELFSLSHIIIIVTHILGIIILLVFVKKLPIKTIYIIRWGLFFLLIFSELSYQTWGIYNEAWNPREFLPLQLCSISGVIAILALLTQNQKLIQITFFIAIFPAFLAVITPELFHGFPHFRFWQFFIHHLVLSWAGIFLVVTNNVNISLKITLEIYTYLFVYAGIIGFLVNPLFNANFLFLAKSPSANTPLEFLGVGLCYYVNLCLIGLGFFLLQLGIYKIMVRIYHRGHYFENLRIIKKD